MDIVIQTVPPRSADTYLHRAGRCGRAGKKGMAITLCSPSQYVNLRKIASECKVMFEEMDKPSQKELMETGAKIVDSQ